MYNLSYSNPTVDIFNTDGSVDNSSIVSNLTYSNGTLVFNIFHFTTFIARESSQGSTSFSTPVVPTCNLEKPDRSSDLF